MFKQNIQLTKINDTKAGKQHFPNFGALTLLSVDSSEVTTKVQWQKKNSDIQLKSKDKNNLTNANNSKKNFNAKSS